MVNEFWWNWVVSALAALGTLLAVIVALFGGRFRSAFFRPRLQLNLRNLEGEPTKVELQSPDGTSRMEDARYYHVRVSNMSRRRWPTATNVQVYLVRVSERGPDQEFVGVWTGEVPLRWRFQEVHPLLRDIGSPADCDVCSVVKDKWLSLHPIIVPHSLNVMYRQGAQIRLQLEARAIEIDSEPLTIEIAWDGKWADGAQEMKRHLVIKEVT
jgi:hypothetical protein